MPTAQASSEDDLQQVLVNAELATSRSQAKTHIESNAIMVNGEKVSDAYYKFQDADKLFGRYLLSVAVRKTTALSFGVNP